MTPRAGEPTWPSTSTRSTPPVTPLRTATRRRHVRSPTARDRDERRLPWHAGVPASQLPTVLRGPGDLADRHLDAAGRPGLARPAAHPRPALAGHRFGRPVRPGSRVRP